MKWIIKKLKRDNKFNFKNKIRIGYIITDTWVKIRTKMNCKKIFKTNQMFIQIKGLNSTRSINIHNKDKDRSTFRDNRIMLRRFLKECRHLM